LGKSRAEIDAEIWNLKEADGYVFKKAHATSYAASYRHSRMNLILTAHGASCRAVNELRGGRFTKWDSSAVQHSVEFRDKVQRATLTRRLVHYIEWINENVEGNWCFGFGTKKPT
jgi:hypothetical protein